MRVVTFYSYKGGVGRTLACANFGLYLAKTGQKVVLADMDFEAPGLDSKFFDAATSNISNGLLDQISAFQQGAPIPNLSPMPIALTEEVARSGGMLQLIPAGNYGAPDKYYESLSNIDWHKLLRTEDGLSFWFDLVSRIKTQFNPDVLVIDSRTGITEIGGLCTQVLPDTVLLLSSTSPESMAGTRRMYEIIKNSRVVKEIRGKRPPIDLRVVLTRVPRQDNQEILDRKMKLRLNLEVPRLYYLFADSQLATEEYLAMNSSAGGTKSILPDYVELFATLNPEDTVDYIKSRLGLFREGLTLRKEAESRRVVQELLTLFPRTEVYLEAARYYRLVKESEDAIKNYLNYLKGAPNNKEIILEFAEVCVTAPLATVNEQRDSVIRHLSTLGPASMDAPTLSLFCVLAVSPEQRQLIVAAIEDDPAKLTAQGYRVILFRALGELEQWDKIAASATDLDLKDVSTQRILAKAYAKLHAPDKALQILHRLPVRDPTDALPIIEIFYDLRADVDQATIRKAIQENRHLEAYFTHFGRSGMEHPAFARRDDRDFKVWFRGLVADKNVG
jgi:MinD-like ATPase involved in chromosome partitioning or flagellar assembly